MPRRLLVTGAAGFIGSHLVDRLLDEGWRVTALDNFDAFYDVAIKHTNIADHLRHKQYTLYQVDICDRDALASLDGNYDVIVHLAAKAGVRPSISDPVGYQQTNVEGTQNLLECARQWNITQFVFASSSSVYGINPRVPWCEEDHVLLPISPYASTKVSGELLGHVYSHLYGIRFLALRFFTVYGPRQRPDLAIHKFARLILDDKPITLFGDGNTSRDYTFVSDVVGGIRSAMEYQDSLYEVINLGNNKTVSLRTMVHSIERALGRAATVEHVPVPPGDVPQTWADVQRAKNLLGYEPSVDWQDGVDEFIVWLKSF